jgi:hypothetical protein
LPTVSDYVIHARARDCVDGADCSDWFEVAPSWPTTGQLKLWDYSQSTVLTEWVSTECNGQDIGVTGSVVGAPIASASIHYPTGGCVNTPAALPGASALSLSGLLTSDCFRLEAQAPTPSRNGSHTDYDVVLSGAF